MARKRKLFIPDSIGYADPWLGQYDLTANLAIADTVLFTGGADVSPVLYGEEKGSRTYIEISRDIREKELFEFSYSRGKNFIGICRGAQFLCVMAGGKLVQHTGNHNSGFRDYHRTVTSEGGEIWLNSLHHQMMLPGKINHKVLAWVEGLSPFYLNGENQPITPRPVVEPEVVAFPDIRAIGIQCHPEYGLETYPKSLEYLNKVVKETLHL